MGKRGAGRTGRGGGVNGVPSEFSRADSSRESIDSVPLRPPGPLPVNPLPFMPISELILMVSALNATIDYRGGGGGGVRMTILI